MDEPILKNDITGAELPEDETTIPATESADLSVTAGPETTDTSAEGEADTAVEDEAVEMASEETAAEDDDPLAHAFENYTAEHPRPKRWPIVVLSVLLAVVFIGGILWACGVFDHLVGTDTDDTGNDSGVGTADVSDLEAMKTENFTITNGMLAFDIEYWYQNFTNYYGSYLSYFGLDTTKSLKEQTAYSGEESWFDYFAAYARNDAEFLLVMNEAAKKNGVTLGTSAKNMVDEYVSSTDFSTFHNGVSKEDVEQFFTLYYTATTQENMLFNTINVSEADVNAHYEENPAAYQVCDYVYMTVPASAENATTVVDALAACTDAAAFRTAAIQYLIDSGSYDTSEEAATDYDANAVVTEAAYSEDDGISSWLFAADTKVGATRTVTNSDSSVTVYMLAATPTRNTEKVVNVRHILLTTDTYGSEDAAKKKADELLATFKGGEATSESFAALASEYTEDSNGSNGGLYTGLTNGKMTAAFNDWCFDAARHAGDVDIVKTDYGYHVMYFEGAQETWYYTVWSELLNEEYSKQYEALQKEYPITTYEENISKIDL